VNRILFILFVTSLIAGAPYGESYASPPRNEWVTPEYSAGGDDDEPLKTVQTTHPAEPIANNRRIAPVDPAPKAEKRLMNLHLVIALKWLERYWTAISSR